MKKLLLLILLGSTINLKAQTISSANIGTQSTPARTTSHNNVIGTIFDGTYHRTYVWEKYAWLDTTTTGKIATRHDISLKTNRSQTLSINGVTYNLSGNRSWTVGDVFTSGSYSNPSWLTSLTWSKITGAPSIYSFTGTPSQYTKGDGTYGAFPTNISSFTNDVGYLTSEVDPIWSSEKSGYRTKIQNDGLYYPLLSNPNGYLTSYTETDPVWTTEKTNYRTKTQNDVLYQPLGSYITTETDPTVPSYSKSLSGFNIIKASTDVLYKPIGYIPTNGEILGALGYTPYNGTTNSNGYITLSSVLTGFSTGNNIPISSSNSLLTALQNLQSQITSINNNMVVNNATIGLSKSTLNSTYPNALMGFKVFCPNILLGGAIYIKNNSLTGTSGTWQTISAPPTL